MKRIVFLFMLISGFALGQSVPISKLCDSTAYDSLLAKTITNNNLQPVNVMLDNLAYNIPFLCDTNKWLATYAYVAAHGGSGWKINGNSGISPSSFIGTTDGSIVSFTTKINNKQSGRIDSVQFGDAFYGYRAGEKDLAALGNADVAVGYEALQKNVTGGNNTAIGYQALNAATNYNNTAVGNSAFLNLTSGQNNTALGSDNGQNFTTGSDNMSIGYATLNHSNGSHNTAIGSQALIGSGITIYTSTGNTAIGYLSIEGITSGSKNTAIGDSSLISNTTGSNNIAVGYQAGLGNTTGSNQIFLGNANITNTTGILTRRAGGLVVDTTLVTGVTSVTGSGNIASSGGSTPNITFTGVLPIANGGTATSTVFNRGSVLFTTGSGGIYGTDSYNFHYSKLSGIHALSVTNNGDTTGTDLLNLVNGQLDINQAGSGTLTTNGGISFSGEEGTSTSPTKSSAGDTIAGPQWWPYNGSTWIRTSQIYAIVKKATNVPTTELHFSNKNTAGTADFMYADTNHHLNLNAPLLGTPTSGNLTNCTGLPTTGITGFTNTDGHDSIGVDSTKYLNCDGKNNFIQNDTTWTTSSAGANIAYQVNITVSLKNIPDGGKLVIWYRKKTTKYSVWSFTGTGANGKVVVAYGSTGGVVNAGQTNMTCKLVSGNNGYRIEIERVGGYYNATFLAKW